MRIKPVITAIISFAIIISLMSSSGQASAEAVQFRAFYNSVKGKEIDSCRERLKEDSNDYQAYALLALYHLATGNLAEYIANYNSLRRVRDYKFESDPFKQVRPFFTEVYRLKELHNRYVTELEQNPNDYRNYIRLAELLKPYSVYPAEKFYQQAYRLQKDYRILVQLADLYLNSGRPHLASDYIRRALKLEKRDASLYYRLANICYQTGQIEKAQDFFREAERVRKLTPAYRESDIDKTYRIITSGRMQTSNGRRETVRASGKRLRELRSSFEGTADDSVVYLSIATIYLEFFYDCQQAESNVSQAIRREPGLSSSYLLYSRIKAEQRDYSEAYRLLSRALLLASPGDKAGYLPELQEYYQKIIIRKILNSESVLGELVDYVATYM